MSHTTTLSMDARDDGMVFLFSSLLKHIDDCGLFSRALHGMGVNVAPTLLSIREPFICV